MNEQQFDSDYVIHFCNLFATLKNANHSAPISIQIASIESPKSPIRVEFEISETQLTLTDLQFLWIKKGVANREDFEKKMVQNLDLLSNLNNGFVKINNCLKSSFLSIFSVVFILCEMVICFCIFGKI